MKIGKLCAWSRDDINGKRDKLAKIVSDPGYVCARCARVSAKKKYLCKPEKLG